MSTVAETIKSAREALGISQSQLARETGVSQQTIAKIESGTARRSRYLPMIADRLGVSFPELGIHPKGVERSISPVTKAYVTRPGFVGADDEHMPVFSTIQSSRGPLFRSADEPIEWMARPNPLKASRGYGLYLVEHDMVPAFDPGDIALVHESLPPLPMTYCVFFTQPEDGVMRVLVRQLLSVENGTYRVKSFSPPQESTLNGDEWVRVQRIVGRYLRA